MQPAFSLTFLSPYRLASEPSSFQEIHFRKKPVTRCLYGYYSSSPPCPASQKAFDIWTMKIAQAVSFPYYFIFASLQLHVVISLHISISASMKKPSPSPRLPFAHIYSIFFLLMSWVVPIFLCLSQAFLLSS